MNRTALCIQMLNLLKSRGLMTREELAGEMQTNVRNISEFRKELEIAGYAIETVSGKYGGYRLAEDTLLQVPALKDSEKRSLQEAGRYLQSHPDFRYQCDFQSALDKINAGLRDQLHISDVYIKNRGALNDHLQKLLDICETGIQQQREVLLTYRSMRADRFADVRIHPYEILNYQQAYYCLGYSLKAKDYRIYKFSEERMKNALISEHTFVREKDFKLSDHIGESGLIKDRIHELDLTISAEEALLIAEQPPGIHCEMEWLENKKLHLHMFMEGDVAVRMFLLSLGSHVIIHSPKRWQTEIQNIAKTMAGKDF